MWCVPEYQGKCFPRTVALEASSTGISGSGVKKAFSRPCGLPFLPHERKSPVSKGKRRWQYDHRTLGTRNRTLTGEKNGSNRPMLVDEYPGPWW
jgi:hypothetical protein